MTKRRAKPSTPRVVSECAFNLEAFKLPLNSDVKQEKADRRHVERAVRLDVFSMLKQRKDADGVPGLETSHYESVRRLEADYHTAAGAKGVSEAERVSGGGSSEQVTQRMIDASARVQIITNYMPTHHAALAPLLLDPVSNGALISRWRGHVQRICGITDKQGQADTVRWFSAAVHEAYVALDYGATHHRLTDRPRYGT